MKKNLNNPTTPYHRIGNAIHTPHLRRVLSIMAIFTGISAQAQNHFLLPRDSAFGLAANIQLTRLSAGDLDNDGDLDLIGSDFGTSNIYFYRNIGTPTNPNFSASALRNPFNYNAISGNINLLDLDNDGLLDLLLLYANTPQSRIVSYIRNSGTPENPNFSGTPIELFRAKPGLNLTTMPPYDDVKIIGADLDNDGDNDIIVGSIPYTNSIVDYFENTGSPTSPAFNTNAAPTFYFPITSQFATCSFVDMDNDQDLDAWCGDSNSSPSYHSVLNYIENIGNQTNASFATGIHLAMGLSDTLSNGNAAFTEFLAPLATDIDNDGDIDILLTDRSTHSNNSSLKFYENTRCDALSATISMSGNMLQVANSGALASFQWYKDSIQLANETLNSIDANMYGSGSYTVRVTDTAHCIAYAPAYSFWIVGVHKTASDDSQLRCMPNPATNQLFVESALSFERFDIINAQGQTVRSIGQPSSQQIQVSDLAQGIYVLRGYTAQGAAHSTRFIKQ